MGPDSLRRGAGLRPRLGTRLPDDLVRLLRHDGARGAGHQAHQDWHRRRDSRHSYRAGYRAFDRDDQPDRAGRVFLGIGTGHTAMRVMGQHPMPLKEFREYLRVVRTLLHGEAVDYTFAGATREITFLHRDRHFINLENPIPIYVAANGPRACEAAGMYGDGWITAGATDIRPKLPLIVNGAKKAGRKLPQPFVTTALITGCVLRPGERLSDERVIQETGSYVTAILHFAYEIWSDLGKRDELIPPYFRNNWGRYLEHVASFSLPEEKRFRQVHDGHCTYMQR